MTPKEFRSPWLFSRGPIEGLKILITGGEGYIGSNLEPLLENSIIYDLKRGLDIRNRTKLVRYVEKADAVIHLAAIAGIETCAEDPESAVNTNILGTMNVIKECTLQGKNMVFASSQAVHHPSVYGATKLLGERMTVKAGFTACRLSNVWGGRRFLDLKDSAVARLNKGTWEDRGHDDEVRDFIHVDKVCKHLIAALQWPSGVYETCSGEKITIRELKNRFIQGDFRAT